MTKVTCAFAEARISKENSVFTVKWIQVFVKSGVALGQAVSPHAGELSVGEQRGGFTGLRLCRRLLFFGMLTIRGRERRTDRPIDRLIPTILADRC